MPTIGERFREWFEAPSYEEGVGVDGRAEGLPSEKEGGLGGGGCFFATFFAPKRSTSGRLLPKGRKKVRNSAR